VARQVTAVTKENPAAKTGARERLRAGPLDRITGGMRREGVVAKEGIEPPTLFSPSLDFFYRVKGMTKGIKIIKMW
jgi:hypothetical protein